MVAPVRIDRLVFAAFTYKGEGSPTLTKRAEQLAYFRSHNMRKRDRDGNDWPKLISKPCRIAAGPGVLGPEPPRRS